VTEVTQKKPGGSWKERVVLVVAAVVVLAVVLGGAYYQEDLSTYFHLQAWDKASPEKLVQDFVSKVHAGDPAAANDLDGQRARPVMSGGKLKSIDHPGAMGRADTRLDQIVPKADIQSMVLRIRPRAQIFGISVEYTDGQWAEFGVDRTRSGLKIVDVSLGLGKQKLQEQN